jgi:hypothetical protein
VRHARACVPACVSVRKCARARVGMRACPPHAATLHAGPTGSPCDVCAGRDWAHSSTCLKSRQQRSSLALNSRTCIVKRLPLGCRIQSPGADVAGVSPVPVQTWQGRAQSRYRSGGRAQFRCRCGRGGPSPSPDLAARSRRRCGQQGRAQSRRRCGRGEPSPGADVAGASPVGLAYKGHRALGTVSAQLQSPGNGTTSRSACNRPGCTSHATWTLHDRARLQSAACRCWCI